MSPDISPVAVSIYLKGMDYPAKKADLINHAKGNGAPESIIDHLSRLPERTYYYPTDVMDEILK